MTTPRSNQIDINSTPYYHCMTRCVRRSYLCGMDELTGRDYSHRKPWILSRIKHLADIFAIHVCAYAIMSNHYHLVLYVNEDMALKWTDEEVQARWRGIFPSDAKSLSCYSNEEAAYKLKLWRQRLMDISWFMRCLNEKIARVSNKEDETKGRFWEGRFKSQALLDEGAVLSAMVYVDLNPIRAKTASTLEGSNFTSIQERLATLAKELKKNKSIEESQQPNHLMPFVNSRIGNSFAIDFKFRDYLTLIDETGRMLREGKRGVIPNHVIPILTKLELNPREWMSMVNNLQNQFSYAIGHCGALLAFHRGTLKHGPKGYSTSKHYYAQTA